MYSNLCRFFTSETQHSTFCSFGHGVLSLLLKIEYFIHYILTGTVCIRVLFSIVQLFIHCNSKNYKLSEEIVKREDVDVNSIVRV